jgi:hypothetical protein
MIVAMDRSSPDHRESRQVHDAFSFVSFRTFTIASGDKKLRFHAANCLKLETSQFKCHPSLCENFHDHKSKRFRQLSTVAMPLRRARRGSKRVAEGQETRDVRAGIIETKTDISKPKNDNLLSSTKRSRNLLATTRHYRVKRRRKCLDHGSSF